MTHKAGSSLWIAGAFGAGIAVTAIAVGAYGPHYRAVVAAVRGSARVAFLFFWLAYAGGALATLFGDTFARLALRRREFGLAFAAALAVHLSLVAVLFRVSSHQPISNTLIAYFGAGAVYTYLLAAGSIERVRRAVPQRAWRIIGGIGMEYILFLFILDLVVHPIRDGFGSPLDYAPFSLLAVVAPVLRWAAVLQRRRTTRLSAIGRLGD
jgi:hypothetical protein